MTAVLVTWHSIYEAVASALEDGEDIPKGVRRIQGKHVNRSSYHLLHCHVSPASTRSQSTTRNSSRYSSLILNPCSAIICFASITLPFVAKHAITILQLSRTLQFSPDANIITYRSHTPSPLTVGSMYPCSMSCLQIPPSTRLPRNAERGQDPYLRQRHAWQGARGCRRG